MTVSQRLAARLLPLALVAAACSAPPTPDNLLIVSLDTVRRDHTSVYGYERETTPGLSALASGAVVFDDAIAQEVNTTPSHASMFTGVYPHVHGSLDNRWPLPAGQTTLAQILAAQGFRTAAFVSGVIMHRQLSGLDRGFEVYEDRLPGDRRDGAQTVALALDWLRRVRKGERFFLFVHLYDAHGPYRPPPEYAGLFVSVPGGATVDDPPPYQRLPDEEGNVSHELGDYVDRYDGALRYLDDLVSRLLADVDLSSTAVVVLSDHGETLGERYYKLDHGGQLFDEQIRIPLIVSAPGLRPQRIRSPAETVDLLPTLLELLDVPLPAERPVQGRDLLPLMRGVPDDGGRLTFSAARALDVRHADRGYELDQRRRLLAVRSRRFKLIAYPARGESDYLELYDLANDPHERRSVFATAPRVAGALLDELQRWAAGEATAQTAPPELDAETERRLRALGYVD